ncbi:site-2 protease family protein [Microbaculum sp. FT89]|uniref:site-2 protease family protein n=1 Tax=Microbaculum sp. FT89 TaxID=3447298 RepID=UPI003F52D3D4
MPWSLTVGRIAGTDVRIHLTFLLLLAWIGVAHYIQGGAAAAIEGVLFISAVFLCVVLHEFGHAMAARHYGIGTKDITLLPIGGLARLERFPEKPGQEIVVAAAGPAVNVVIAVVLILIFGFPADPAALQQVENPQIGFFERLAAVNIFLVVFNLIPAFPMDGGRVLRAALSYRLDRFRATEVAASIGQALAFFFGFMGLIGGNAILVFIAIFVYLAATAEAASEGLMALGRKIRVDDAMIRSFETLRPDETVDDAAEALIRTTQSEFPIVDGGGHLRAFLTRSEMIHALKATGSRTPVLEAATGKPLTVTSGMRLDRALNAMQQAGAAIFGVTDRDDRLIGYVSQENIGELMMLGEANWHKREAAKPAESGSVPRVPPV